jgi:hypothetical protein
MKKSLLFIKFILIGILASGINSSYASIPALTAPTITIEPQNVTKSSIFVRIVDTNASETGLELVQEENGNMTTYILSPGSVFNLPYNGLKAKTTYSYKVRAFDGSSFSDYSALAYGTTLVDVPGQAKLTLGYNCPMTVGFSWDIAQRPEDVQDQIVQRSTDNASWNPIGYLFPGERFLSDNDPIPGKTLYYRVVTKNVSGLTFSNPLVVTVPNYVAPKNPMNVNSSPALRTANSLTIAWDNPAQDLACKTDNRATTYLVAKLASEETYKVIAELNPNATSATIEGLKQNDIVDYRVWYMSTQGIQSSWIGGRDTTWGPPPVPTNLIVVGYTDNLGNSSFDVKWKDVSSREDYYVVEYSNDSLNFKQLGKIKANETVLKQYPIEEGTKYYYRVKAGNILGESAYTPTTFAVKFDYTKAPSAPTNLVAKVTGTTAVLTWRDDSSREENVIVEKSKDDGLTFTQIASLAKNTVTYTDAGLELNKTVQYRLYTKNPKGQSGYSNVAEAKAVGTVGLLFNEISFFPNPTSDFLKISFPADLIGNNVTVKILDKNNISVYSNTIKVDSKNFEINASQFSEGLYNVILSTEDSQISRKLYKR